MPAYLVSAQFAIPIQLSDRYAGRWRVMGKELYIDVACTQRVALGGSPIQLPANCTEAYTITSPGLFHTFLMSWMDQSLVLYRGFPGCHYAWPDLLEGVLRSEGYDDRPEFTMNESGRGTTRWLPAADRALAEGVSIQCCDAHTRELSMREPVPIGFTVQIPCGSAKNLPLCWLNAGEIVVRGPLMTGEYLLCTIAWLDVAQVSFRPWPNTLSNVQLPPQRPYKPGAAGEIDAWWELCQPWMERLCAGDAVIRARRQQQAVKRIVLEANLRDHTLV